MHCSSSCCHPGKVGRSISGREGRGVVREGCGRRERQLPHVVHVLQGGRREGRGRQPRDQVGGGKGGVSAW